MKQLNLFFNDFNISYNFIWGFSIRLGSDIKCCLKFRNCGKTSPLIIKSVNHLYFCSISGNSISATGNDHPAWPRKNCTQMVNNIHI